MNRKKDSNATVDISEIKNAEPVSLFIIQVAAPSWAATQVPEITLAIQSCLKTGFLRAVQVEYLTMLILLKKVGGGYIFIHRMLLEYFAELDTPRNSAIER